MCSLSSSSVLMEHPHLYGMSFGNYSHWHNMHEMILSQLHLHFCKSHVPGCYAMILKKSGLILVFLFIPKVEGVMSATAKQYFTQNWQTEISFPCCSGCNNQNQCFMSITVFCVLCSCVIFSSGTLKYEWGSGWSATRAPL